MTEGQRGTETNLSIEKETFLKYIPDKFQQHSSFTWNFENETFSVNQDYVKAEGSIMTEACFIPEVILPIPGLKKKYQDFVEDLGYVECNIENFLFESLLKNLFRV